MRFQVCRMVYADAVGIGPEDVVSWQGNARPITLLPWETKNRRQVPGTCQAVFGSYYETEPDPFDFCRLHPEKCT